MRKLTPDELAERADRKLARVNYMRPPQEYRVYEKGQKRKLRFSGSNKILEVVVYSESFIAFDPDMQS